MSTSNSGSGKAVWQLYLYTPSLAAAAVAIVVFTLLTAVHCYRLMRTGLWFCIPFIVGGLFEAIGYVGRALAHTHPQATTPYIMQSLLILVAPALFAATIYMTLGRLMRATHCESYSIIPVKWLTTLFVIGDVLSFFIQGGGGGIMATSDGNSDKIKTGENIIIGGLFFQLLIFLVFVISAIIFHVRMRKSPPSQRISPGVESTLMVLYVVSGLIMARNIVRVVEYIGGRSGPLLRVEWPIYAFDALFMAATMALFLFRYPTIVRPVFRDTEANTELHPAQTMGVRAEDGKKTHFKGWQGR